MQKNVTLRLDENLLIKARHAAIEKGFSLSQWMANLLNQAVNKDENLDRARKRAFYHLKKGYRLGGKPLTREEIHDRPSMLH